MKNKQLFNWAIYGLFILFAVGSYFVIKSQSRCDYSITIDHNNILVDTKDGDHYVLNVLDASIDQIIFDDIAERDSL